MNFIEIDEINNINPKLNITFFTLLYTQAKEHFEQLDGENNPKIVEIIANYHKMPIKEWEFYFTTQAVPLLKENIKLSYLYLFLNVIKCLKTNYFVYIYFGFDQFFNQWNFDKNEETLKYQMSNLMLCGRIYEFIKKMDLDELYDYVTKEISDMYYSRGGLSAFLTQLLIDQKYKNSFIEFINNIITFVFENPDLDFYTKRQIIDFLYSNISTTSGYKLSSSCKIVHSYDYQNKEPILLNPNFNPTYCKKFEDSEFYKTISSEIDSIDNENDKIIMLYYLSVIYYCLNYLEEFNDKSKYISIYNLVSSYVLNNKNEQNINLSDGLFLIIRDICLSIQIEEEKNFQKFSNY